MSDFNSMRFARATPCDECPWRCDVAVGRFPPERFEKLVSTIGGSDGFRPIFACHKAPEGDEFACAGYLLTEGLSNLAVRIAAGQKRFDPRALHSPYPLYKRYEEMARANGCKMKNFDREIRGFPHHDDKELEAELLQNPKPRLKSVNPEEQKQERMAVIYLQMWEGYELSKSEWEFLMNRGALTVGQTQWRTRIAMEEAELPDHPWTREQCFAKAIAVGVIRSGIGKKRRRPVGHLEEAKDMEDKTHINRDPKVQEMCAQFLQKMFPRIHQRVEFDAFEAPRNFTVIHNAEETKTGAAQVPAADDRGAEETLPALFTASPECKHPASVSGTQRRPRKSGSPRGATQGNPG